MLHGFLFPEPVQIVTFSDMSSGSKSSACELKISRTVAFIEQGTHT
ncbi:Uncharacterized protein dnl_38530 [Desulfonema limicola]|uniref:Uncharacterized protein n=1 Tax=Desulfonema limicola TaxID=45656 RepID=A0A975BA27_9BACT|nr:Uncharacterized protein dnl_38530 [Desulfonema limicola]